MTKLSNKISVKSVCGETKTLVPETGEKLLMRIVGVVNGTIVKESQYGESIGLRGQFQAENKDTGEVFVSSTAWLPKTLSDSILGAFNGEPLQFAADIGVKKAANAIGYEYTITMHGNQTHDLFAAIEKQLCLPGLNDAKAA
jgi:hypothetical protein